MGLEFGTGGYEEVRPSRVDVQADRVVKEHLKYLTAPVTDANVIRVDVNGVEHNEPGYVRYDDSGERYAISTTTVLFANVVRYVAENRGMDFVTALSDLQIPESFHSELMTRFGSPPDRFQDYLFRANLVQADGLTDQQRASISDIISSPDRVVGQADQIVREGVSPGSFNERVVLPDGRYLDIKLQRHNEPLAGRVGSIIDPIRDTYLKEVSQAPTSHPKGYPIAPKLMLEDGQVSDSLSEAEKGRMAAVIDQFPLELRHLVNEVIFARNLRNKEGLKVSGFYSLNKGVITIDSVYLDPNKKEELRLIFYHEMTHQLEDFLAATTPDVFRANYSVWGKMLESGLYKNNRVDRERQKVLKGTHPGKAPLNELIACSMGAYYSILAGMDPIEAFRWQHFDIQSMTNQSIEELMSHCERVNRSYIANLGEAPLDHLLHKVKNGRGGLKAFARS